MVCTYVLKELLFDRHPEGDKCTSPVPPASEIVYSEVTQGSGDLITDLEPSPNSTAQRRYILVHRQIVFHFYRQKGNRPSDSDV